MVVVIVLLFGRVGLGADNRVLLEIGVSNISPSSSSSSNWGWWNPGKYDEWMADDSSEFGLADLRIVVAGENYTVILEGERYPTLTAVGTSDDDQSTDELSMETTIYDLGYGQWFGKDERTGVLPWIGLTYMRISESRTIVPDDGSGGNPYPDKADSNLWGVVLGADASYPVWSSIDLTGRLLLRWATGTRTAEIDSGGGTAEEKGSIDHFMWGIDLGVRWNATKAFSLEAGWRYRDRTIDQGPASFGGPQIKAAFEF